MAEGDTIVNAVIGAVVSIVLSFIPFSPIVGGMAASYLEGGDRSAGLRVGIIAGVIALLPFAVMGVFFGGFGAFMMMGGMPMGIGAMGLFFLLFALFVGAVYSVGLSALGGWLGNYIKYDTDIGR